MKQTDERDIMFCRLGYEAGSDRYEDYYRRHPEHKLQDDDFRSRPFLGGEEATFHHAHYSHIPDANFEFLADIRHLCDGKPAPTQVAGTAEAFTQTIKGLLTYYGASLVGITEAKPELYYSHLGRPPAQYGQPIAPDYPTAIVFAWEMAEELIFCAPRLPESIAVTKGYVDAAIGGMQLSYYIRNLGYRARNNMDGNYLMPLVPLAVSAGLGELGKHGLLLTQEFGSRVRLGAVLTDLPLILDAKKPKGFSAFCDRCNRCVTGCPGKAIAPSEGGYFSDDKCFTMWQRLGTDCGVCVATCPFSNHLPPELLSEMDTPQGLEALVAYCDTYHPRRPFLKDDPQWMPPTTSHVVG